MQCQNRRIDKTLVVELSGQLDNATAQPFEDHCRQSMGQGEQGLVLDFARLEYLSSAGLRSILTIAKHAKTLHETVSISNARGPVREVLEVSGLSTIFPFLDSPGEPHRQHA